MAIAPASRAVFRFGWRSDIVASVLIASVWAVIGVVLAAFIRRGWHSLAACLASLAACLACLDFCLAFLIFFFEAPFFLSCLTFCFFCLALAAFLVAFCSKELQSGPAPGGSVPVTRRVPCGRPGLSGSAAACRSSPTHGGGGGGGFWLARPPPTRAS